MSIVKLTNYGGVWVKVRVIFPIFVLVFTLPRNIKIT